MLVLVNITSFTSIKFNYSNYVLFVGSQFLDGKMLVMSFDNRSQYSYVTTFTKGVTVSILIPTDGSILINTKDCSTITVSTPGVSHVMHGISDETLTYLDYSQGVTNYNITAYDYIGLVSYGNTTFSITVS